jgi:hypothetical protein
MDDPARTDTLRATEAWFHSQGLPYFVSGQASGVRRALAPRRLVVVLLVGAGVGLVSGVVAGIAADDVSLGVLVWALVVGGVAVLYALASLHLAPILGWAARRTFSSLGWFFPLVVRALPLLLLFTTFLFINAEVWQVASTLDRGMLWLTVLLFGGLAVVFLLARLPEEVDNVKEDAEGERLVRICAGTPVEEAARTLSGRTGDVRLNPLQRANLVLVLLISQVLQVLVLALAVFGFFIAFGLMAIREPVITAWTGIDDPVALAWLPVSNELFQVSVFLAAFSGLYFTVYAVTDEVYRKEFFTSISDELERAIGVQVVYRALRTGNHPGTQAR